jgi:hypothetical protein
MQHKNHQQDNLQQEELANHPRKSQKHTGENIADSTKKHSEKRKNPIKDTEEPEENSPTLKDSKAKAETHDRKR